MGGQQQTTYLLDEDFLTLQCKGQGIPANLNRVPGLETKDEEKFRLPVSVRCHQ